ncbi:MAG: hypothetical protein OXR73_36505 [Myxococcales bacterium]|nr:hypothetical protein [Myxococcales bacterium]
MNTWSVMSRWIAGLALLGFMVACSDHYFPILVDAGTKDDAGLTSVNDPAKDPGDDPAAQSQVDSGPPRLASPTGTPDAAVESGTDGGTEVATAPEPVDAGKVVEPSDPPMEGECSPDGATDECYEGPADTAGVGVCQVGTQTCQGGTWGGCEGQVIARDETCDGTDEDCDGMVDEQLTLGSCMPEDGGCGTGRLVCAAGMEVCEPTNDQVPEACNGEDDDCDGEVDEEADTSCYSGETGCEQVNGEWQCEGICQPGERSCDNGQLTGLCVGQVGPSLLGERCGPSPAVDDDCDGTVDEGCPCSPNDMQACYTGPEGTEGVGACKSGTQACLLGTFATCNDQVVPAPETCANRGEDNDCDGDANEVREGGVCLTGRPGLCAFGTQQCRGDGTECVPNNQPRSEACNVLDDDCDGRTDETFNLLSNRNTCGSCFIRCFGSQDCCNGVCSNTNNDPRNCGQCGRRCSGGEVCSRGACACPSGSTRCGGACVDTNTANNNCGDCGNVCRDGRVCRGGDCVCPGSQILCGGQCVAPVCGGGCACTGAGMECCGGDCVDTRSDKTHCGGCSQGGSPACTGDLSCIDSRCDCNSGTRCGDQCVNPNTDPEHCGGCDKPCPEGQTCQNGVCG